jgi:hypothetical protein
MNANMNEAIKNLQVVSEALEKAANKPENYNTDYARYLEIMSWEMHKQSNELKTLNRLYGGF